MEHVAEPSKQHESSAAISRGRADSPAAASLPSAFELQQLAGNQAMRRLAFKLGCRISTNPLAPFLVQMTKTLAPGEYSREPGFAPYLGAPIPERMSPAIRAAR